MINSERNRNLHPLLVNTTFGADPAVIDHLRRWVRDIAIPAIEASATCHSPLLLRILADHEEEAGASVSYAFQYQTVSAEACTAWLSENWQLLLASLYDGITPEQLPLYTTIMEIETI
ncbi:MAG: DUF4286 family protein [Clostridium sp.]|nr:DUF4286 family protein [Clostridium sp.]